MIQIIKKTTELSSWEELKNLAEMGILDSVLSSGDEIPFNWKDGGASKLIAARDETGKVFFTLGETLRVPQKYGAKGCKSWSTSSIRKFLNDEVFKNLPDEMREVIVPTHIVQKIDGNDEESEDKLFLLSGAQVAGISECWSDAEETKLDIFKGRYSRERQEPYGGAQSWLLRDQPRDGTAANGENRVYAISSGGVIYDHPVEIPDGVIFAFCID